ncbi:hypothetical protein Bbelb_102530 [Branchiostoma belcheri]|nr:hypothetical protein Bbelb_102530 [Branchiostoma belcheri]
MEFEEHDGKQNGRLGPHLSKSLELLDRQSSLQIRQSRQSNERLIQEYRHNNDNVAQKQLVLGQSAQRQFVQGQLAQRKLAKGQSIQGQSVQGQSVQGQLVQGQPVQGQFIQGQSVLGQLVQGHPVQGQSVQGPLVLGQSAQRKLAQGQSIQGQSFQGQPVQGQSIQGQLAQRQSFQGQSVQGQFIQGQLVPGQSVHGQFAPGQPVQGQSVLGQSVQGQPVHGQLTQRQLVQGPFVQQGQSVQGHSVLGQSVQGQWVQGQLVHGQLVLGQSIQGPQAIQVKNEVQDLSTLEMHAGEGSQTRSPGSSHFRQDRLDSGVEILSPDTERTHSFYVSDDTAGRSLRSQWTNAWVVQTQQQPASHIVLQPIRIELQSRPSNGEQVNRTTEAGGGLRSGVGQSEDAPMTMALWLQHEDWRRYCGTDRPQNRVFRARQAELETNTWGPVRQSADPLLSPRPSRLPETRSDDEGVRGRSLSVGTHLERSLRSQRTNDWVGQLAPVRIQGELQPREPVSHRSAPDAARKISTKPRLDPDDTYDRFETFVQSLDNIRTDSDPDDAPMTMAYWLQNCAWSRYSHVEGFWRYPRYARDYPLDGTKNRRSRGRRSKSLGPVTSGGAHSASEDERGRGYRQVLVPSRSRQESSDVDGDRENRHGTCGDASWFDLIIDSLETTSDPALVADGTVRQITIGTEERKMDILALGTVGRGRPEEGTTSTSGPRGQIRRVEQGADGITIGSASSDDRSQSQDRSRPTAGVHVETKVEGDVSKDSSGTQLKQRAASATSTGKASEGNGSKNNPVTTGSQKTTQGAEDGIKRSLSVAMSVGLLAGKQKDDTKTEGKSEASQPVGKGSAQETTSRSPGVTSVFKRSFFGSKSDDKDQAGSPTDTQGNKATGQQAGTDDTKAMGDAGSRKGLLSASLFGALKSEKQNDDIKTRGNSDSHPVGKDGVQEQTTRSPGVTSVFKRSFFGSKSDDKDQAGSPADTQGKKATGQQTAADDTKDKGDSGFGSVFKRSFFTSKAADNDSDALSMHSIKDSIVKNDEKPKEESGSFSFMSMIRRRSSSASSLSSSEDDRKKKHRRPVVTGGRKNADKDPESSGIFGGLFGMFSGGDGKSQAEREAEHSIMASRGDDSDGSSSQGRRESILGALGLHDSSSSSSSSSDDEDGAISSLFSAIGLGSADATGPRKHGGGHKKQDAMKSAWAKRDRGGGAKKGGDSSIFGFLGFGGDSDAHRHSHGHRHRHRGRAPSTPTTPQLPSIFSSFQPN